MKTIITPVVAVFLAVNPLAAEIRLPAIISDHALLQAGKPVAIWGWAKPRAHVKATFVNGDPNSPPGFEAAADDNGKWSGRLPALKSGTAGKLLITTDMGEQETVSDLLVGELWLGGGQSNMEYDIAASGRVDLTDAAEVAAVAQNALVAEKEAAAATPPIRYFRVAASGADQPADDVRGNWILVDPKNVVHCSAVAWNFAVALQNRLHVPLGLIVSCVGNTPVEAWMSKETLAGTAAGTAVYERFNKAVAAATPEAAEKYKADFQAWNAANPTPQLQFQNRATRPVEPYSRTANDAPNRHYNSMIRGLEPYTIRGIIWFQGDGNFRHPLEYSELFQAMIKEWRGEWQDDRLPFYFVEINNMREPTQTRPVQPNAFSMIREQQHGGLLQPGVGMVSSIDLGVKNPHFPNKKPVGERLAGLALRACYGRSGQVNSPAYRGFTVEGNKVRLSFDDAEGLRVRGGGEAKGFALRGRSGNWVWANGRIDGRDIVVWSDQVPAPVAVRYAWAVNPLISVENGAGLPLAPFRTDTDSPE